MYRLRYILLFFLLAVLVASCESTRKLTYLNDIRETGEDSLFTRNLEPYRLQPADILYIRIITQNEEMNQLFNPLMGTGANQQARVGNMYYNGYTVNDSGFIDMPILDTIYVNGLTTGQARERVTRRAVEYLKEPQVIVKLANKRFTLLGEVNGKGVHEVQDDRLNILEALAYGGGISYNGDREHVLILRPTEKGTHTFRVDVTNRDLITSKRYYIQPNDIIFVPPLKTTLFRERTTDYMFMLSTFTSVVSTVFLILNFTK